MKAQSLDQLRARRDRLAHEIEMFKNDCDHWNRTHPTEQPIDGEAMLKLPREMLADLDRKLGLE